MKRFIVTGAGVMIAATFVAEADAQRVAPGPSADTITPSTEAPPPPGAMPSLCGTLIVCGGALEAVMTGLVVTGSPPTTGAVSVDSALDLYANYSDWLSVNSNIKLERQRNFNLDSYFPESNAAFHSEGLTLRQLYVVARPFAATAVYGGKIHPNFGSAYELTPGNFYNFGTDYEQDERIGAGAQYTLPESFGDRVRISFEAFFLDTSVLSQSLFSRPAFDDPDPTVRPHRYALGQFGPSNTNALDSYTLAVRGGEAGRGLSYQVSFTREATDEPGGKNEFGQSIGLQYSNIAVSSRVSLTPYVEYAHFSNFQGNPGLDRHYLVGGLDFVYRRWELAIAGGLRRTRDANNPPGQAFTNAVATQENKAWDHQENISLTYTFPIVDYDLSLGGGVNHVSIAGRKSWSFGPSLGFGVRF